jgi:diguanylate cyclase (GGDEF)-like protein
MNDTNIAEEKRLCRSEEHDRRISELEDALKKAEVTKTIIAQTNTLLDRELFKSTIVSKVAEISAHISDYNTMAAHLMDLISKVVNIDAGVLLLVRSEKRDLGVYLHGDVGRSFIAEVEKRTIDSYVENTGEVLFRNMCSETILSGEATSSGAAQEPLRSFTVFMLSIGAKTLGAIAIGSKTPDAFAKGEIDSVRLIANQAAIVIDDAALYEALEGSKRKIEGLHEIAHTLGTCSDTDTVYQLTVKAAEDILGFHICSSYTVEDHELHVKAASSKVVAGKGVSKKVGGIDIGQSSRAMEVYATGKTHINGNLGADSGFGPVWETFKSGLSAPIGDKGIFMALSPEPDAYNTEDIRLLELLLGHAAATLQRIDSQHQLRQQAIRDPLTGAYNRRYLTESLEQEVARSKRFHEPIGFLIIDVDKFKTINDTYGHQTGDRVLKAVADLLQTLVRKMDMVVRYGGDEFLIVMPALNAAEKIVKDRIEKALWQWNETNGLFDFPVRLSIGFARWNWEDEETVEQVLIKADEKMYREKRKQDRVKQTNG